MGCSPEQRQVFFGTNLRNGFLLYLEQKCCSQYTDCNIFVCFSVFFAAFFLATITLVSTIGVYFSDFRMPLAPHGLFYTPGRDGTRNAARRPGFGGRPRGCGFEEQGGACTRIQRGVYLVCHFVCLSLCLSLCLFRHILNVFLYREGICSLFFSSFEILSNLQVPGYVLKFKFKIIQASNLQTTLDHFRLYPLSE